MIDEKLSFEANVSHIFKKAQQRMYLLRKLRSFSVSQEILQLVYRSLVESILSFNIVSWFGNLTVKNKTKLTRIVNQASKIIGINQLQMCELYKAALKRKAFQISQDPTHPLHSAFQRLPSGRRYRVPFARKNTFKHSFVPSAISILNARF